MPAGKTDFSVGIEDGVSEFVVICWTVRKKVPLRALLLHLLTMWHEKNQALVVVTHILKKLSKFRLLS